MNKHPHFIGQPPEGIGESLGKRLYALDSTTISLFTSIFKSTGRKRKDGKSKGGAKVHTLMNPHDEVPALIRITDAIDADTKHGDLAYNITKDALLAH